MNLNSAYGEYKLICLFQGFALPSALSCITTTIKAGAGERLMKFAIQCTQFKGPLEVTS